MPLRLIFANLRSHALRTLLTVGTLAVSVFLLCFLRTVVVSMRAGVDSAATNRLVVQSAVSLFVDLPLAYQGKIEGVPGVASTCKLQWFGGYFQDQSNFFAQFGVDADRFLEAYPEVRLLEGTEAEFLAKPTGCLIGSALARKFDWQVGSKVPIIGTIFPRLDGKPWDFEVTGIYESDSANVDNATLWFHYEYLEESIRAGAVGGFDQKSAGVGVFMLRVDPGADSVAVSRRVDELFENGPQRVQTTSEAEFQRQFVSMMGGVPAFLGSIGGAIVFAILLAALNTMLMSARQRTREFGILRALGFSDASVSGLLVVEALLVCGLGGALGVGFMMGIRAWLANAMSTMFPVFLLTGETLGMGMGLAVMVGLVAGVVPALQVGRLDPVEALRLEV